MAVNVEGRCEALGMATGPSEAEPFCTTVLRNALAGANDGQWQVVFTPVNTIFAQETAESAHRGLAASLRSGPPWLGKLQPA